MLQSPDISKAKGKPKQFFLKHKGTKEENRHKLFPSLSLQVPFKQIAPLPLQKEGKKKLFKQTTDANCMVSAC